MFARPLKRGQPPPPKQQKLRRLDVRTLQDLLPLAGLGGATNFRFLIADFSGISGKRKVDQACVCRA